MSELRTPAHQRRAGLLLLPLYGLQWTGFVVPIVLAHAAVTASLLGLDGIGHAGLVGRVLLVVGLFTLTQMVAGHRMPIFETPAAVYLTSIIAVTDVALAQRWDQAYVLASVEGALMVVGAGLVLVGVTGAVRRLAVLFTPLVVGTFMVYLALQLIIRLAPLGIERSSESPFGTRAAWVTALAMAAILVLAQRYPLSRTMAMLLVLAVGWIVYGVQRGFVAGDDLDTGLSGVSLLPWGTPVFEIAVIMPFAVAGLFAVVNVVASIESMGIAQRTAPGSGSVRRGVASSGLSTLTMGVMGGIGTVPAAAAVGVVRATGVTSLLSLAVAGVFLMTLGMLPVARDFFASIPGPVASLLILVANAMILATGVGQYRQVLRRKAGRLRIAVVAVLATGAFALHLTGYQIGPPLASHILRDPFIVATTSAVALELLVRVVAALRPSRGPGRGELPRGQPAPRQLE